MCYYAIPMSNATLVKGEYSFSFSFPFRRSPLLGSYAYLQDFSRLTTRTMIMPVLIALG